MDGAIIPMPARNPPDEAWKLDLVRGERGIHPVVGNAMLILAHDPAVKSLLRYDEFAYRALMTAPPPEPHDGAAELAGPYPRAVTDADVTLLQVYFGRFYGMKLSQQTTAQAVAAAARLAGFHPARDYLRGLRWDGITRVGTWLKRYIGAEASAYTEGVGAMFLISMVARIMHPGCKCDYMLILEGEQGSRKSSACAILGGGHFSDGLPDLHHADSVRLSMHLRGKWVIEIAEMSSFGRAEAGALKAFLTQTEERYLPKHAHHEVSEPRQCVFIGTTNKAAYLHDETGGRRFWPVKVGEVDTAALTADRDQLLAEALAEYRRGTHWWPNDAFERDHIAPEQAARFEPDAWEEAIGGYVAEQRRVTVLQVARDALHVETPRLGTADQRRITAILDHLGWRSGPRGTGGMRYFYPVER